MYRNILQGIDNVAIWPLISFVIFFIFFLCLLWWVLSTDKKVIGRMKTLPFEDGVCECADPSHDNNANIKTH